MFRFLARLAGVLLMAAGFVGLVIDGTRTIANGALAFTSIGEVLFRVLGPRFGALEAQVVALSPALWDPVLVTCFLAPAAVIGFVLGFVLLWLGRQPAEGIGYIGRR